MQGNFIKKKVNEFYLLDTNLENIFISEYMAGAPGDYVKVYLFALMYAQSEHYMDNETIAKELGMEVEDVLKAWSYWESMGTVVKHFEDPKDRFNYVVEFISLKEQLYCPEKEKTREDKSIKIADRLADMDIKGMLQSIEQIKGKMLTGTEPATIISWIDDLNVTPDLIIYAYTYCKKVQKKDAVQYVGAVLDSWIKEGLFTKEQVETHLQETDMRHYLYKRVMKALGFNRNATENERNVMDSWFDEMDYTIDKVLEACSKTSGISNPNINYVNSVLVNWKKESGQAVGTGGKPSKEGKVVSTATVFRYYDYIREKAENEALERKQEIYDRLPEIKQIDEEVRELGMKLSRVMVSGAPNAKAQLDKFRQQIDSLSEEKAFLLTENDYPMDYMEISYKCGICKDTGTNDMGERCSCFNERLSEAELWQNS